MYILCLVVFAQNTFIDGVELVDGVSNDYCFTFLQFNVFVALLLIFVLVLFLVAAES